MKRILFVNASSQSLGSARMLRCPSTRSSSTGLYNTLDFYENRFCENLII